MNPVAKDKWLQALRGGEYEQGAGRLRHGDCFCVMGVLCDVYAKEHNITGWVLDAEYVEDDYLFMGAWMFPPHAVQKWSGIDWNIVVAIMLANDKENATFPELASRIEKEL